MDSKDLPKDLLSPYNPQEQERAIYEQWESSGCFNPDNTPSKDGEPYTILMPPPNANGKLHVGHVLFVTLQDMMSRYKRMQGKRVLWIPGVDHAGFETQVVYEKKLEKEGTSRFSMSREKLYKDILDFTSQNRAHMENQLRTLGASCDWSRSFFTLDDKIRDGVYATFKRLGDDGLLYRGLRSVHWCPKHQTGFSDLEIENTEQKDPFYYIQYGPFVIGTVRPETKFADKYVVVNPNDERYAEYKHGQTFEVEWINGPITATVIKDEAGDIERGTGAMTITPWHSSIDWDIAQRHNLNYEQIIDERGKLTNVAGEFAGLGINEARKKVVEKLSSMGLLVKVDENYTHSVPRCYKCNREIEPQLKEQWFIKIKPLASRAMKAIESGEVSFITERYVRVAQNWLSGIHDWNISRQIVWGIPIPAKICKECGYGVPDIDNRVTKCDKCGGEVVDDTDTFDTWFSSGQLPFLTLGYPNGEDYKRHYPTSIIESGNDIVFFWILRMIMLGLYVTGSVPFKEIYLHGMVKDSKGVKMSKSKGNAIDPKDVINEYGVDALRMGYIVGNVPGESARFSPEKVRGYKKFTNKVWNVARFVLTQTDDETEQKTTFAETDAKRFQEWREVLDDITDDMEHHRYHLSSEKIYHYIWHTFADKIIEESKEIMKEGSEEEIASRKRLLLCIFIEVLKTLHPYMPFVTESIWKHIPTGNLKRNKFLMLETWPSKK